MGVGGGVCVSGGGGGVTRYCGYGSLFPDYTCPISNISMCTWVNYVDLTSQREKLWSSIEQSQNKDFLACWKKKTLVTEQKVT